MTSDASSRTARDQQDQPAQSVWSGGQVTVRARCVLAPNPGPMTLDGTNTWVLGEPGARRRVVVDPGPSDEAHLRRVLAAANDGAAVVSVVLLTHSHLDHSEGAARFAQLCGAPVRAMDAGPDTLRDGEDLDVDGLRLRVLATPGHTGDSICLLLPDEGSLITGDSVLGRGTTVVAYPDGELAAYLASLDAMAALADAGRVTAILPGHGPVVEDPTGVLRAYITHRRERLEQVRRAVAEGVADPDAVVVRVYADAPREVWPAARQSVEAQLEYLQAQG